MHFHDVKRCHFTQFVIFCILLCSLCYKNTQAHHDLNMSSTTIDLVRKTAGQNPQSSPSETDFTLNSTAVVTASPEPSQKIRSRRLAWENDKLTLSKTSGGQTHTNTHWKENCRNLRGWRKEKNSSLYFICRSPVIKVTDTAVLRFPRSKRVKQAKRLTRSLTRIKWPKILLKRRTLTPTSPPLKQPNSTKSPKP